MTYISKRFAMICFFICISSLIRSQNFNYTLVTDSTSYLALTEATTLVGNVDWKNQHFGIKLPFHFNACGETTDSITVESNGYVLFSNAKEASIIAANNYTANKDTNNVYNSTIAYEVTGSNGNRILKIQFTNLSQIVLSDTDNFTYQVWLYENGNKIEFHIGPNSLGAHPESASMIILGLINREMNTTDKAYLIAGSQYAAGGQLITGDADFSYLSNVPSPGIVFELIPTF